VVPGLYGYVSATKWLSDLKVTTFAQDVGYCNKDFDALTKKGDTTIDPAERLKYYQQAGELLVDDVPGPFLYNQANTVIVNPQVTGYTPTATENEWPGYLSSAMTLDKSS
jgi:oligopeptide transport system substrate-binding protein